MKRRDLLAGLGGLGVVGAGAVVATRSQTAETVDPVTIEQLDETGTVVGQIQIPEDGKPTLLTVFATWCSTCRRTMPEAIEVYDDGSETQFVSVTNEAVGQATTREDVVDWWETHGGDWPVGVDTDLKLTERFDVRAVPHVVVLDADNAVVYEEQGEKSAAELRDALATV